MLTIDVYWKRERTGRKRVHMKGAVGVFGVFVACDG